MHKKDECRRAFPLSHTGLCDRQIFEMSLGAITFQTVSLLDARFGYVRYSTPNAAVALITSV